MKASQPKISALLSINPTFNIDFIMDQVHTDQPFSKYINNYRKSLSLRASNNDISRLKKDTEIIKMKTENK